MSHRDMDHVAYLRRRIYDLEVAIAAAKRDVPDLGRVRALNRERDQLVSQLEAYEIFSGFV